LQLNAFSSFFSLFFSFLQETFINEVFLQFEYITFTPGDVIINYSDPADRLVILVSGKVHVEFEHSEFHRRPMQMGAGQFFGEMAILGEKDWADSTCFNLMPQNTKEHTEILVFFLFWEKGIKERTATLQLYTRTAMLSL
jgi:CRP-like cAMP-binding protein